MTAVLVLTIFLLLSTARTARLAPLVVWILIAALVWQVAPVSGNQP